MKDASPIDRIDGLFHFRSSKYAHDRSGMDCIRGTSSLFFCLPRRIQNKGSFACGSSTMRGTNTLAEGLIAAGRCEFLQMISTSILR